MNPQGGRRFQTHCLRDLVDTLRRLLQAALRRQHALMRQPLVRRRAILPHELARERPRRHSGPPRQIVHPQRPRQIRLRPSERFR